MGETLIQPCRVREEGLRVVNRFRPERNRIDEYSVWMTVPEEEAPANYVPAAAVIRRVRALIGITGRKACAGGAVRPM
jgi:hypothetical protein